MKSEKKLDELRRKAEERMEQLSARTDFGDPADVSKLIHEFKVQQIELEIQNEELRQAQSDLIATKDRYYNLFNNSPTGHVTIDEQGAIKEANQFFADLVEREPRRLKGRHFYSLVQEEDRAAFLMWFNQILSARFDRHPEIQLVGKRGRRCRVQLYARLNAGGTGGAGDRELIISAVDITDRYKKQQEVEKLHFQLESAISIGNLAWWHMDIPSGNVHINPKKTEMLGYEYQDFEGKSYREFTALLHPDDEPLAMKAMQDHIEGVANTYQVDYRIRAADGGYRWFRDFGKVSVHGRDGKPLVVTGIVLDITEARENEERTRASLKEKETLLKEIHHRVKNNMNVISSLLSLQENTVADEQMKEVLRVSQGRIQAMASVHEALYSSDNLAEIDLKVYLQTIMMHLIQTYTVSPSRIKTGVQGDEVRINAEKASPLGLIVNELISNSLKYAFPDQQSGELSVTIKQLENALELTVMDNGVGMPEETDWRNSESLGLKLVHILAENQLKGSVHLERTQGARFTITIPV